MAPVQPSVGPSRDEPRVFGLDKFNGDNFAEWSFRMENIFDHYDLLEVMEGTEKRPENDPEKSPWHDTSPGLAHRTRAVTGEACHIGFGQRAEVKGMGKAMFKGADGKMVGLKNQLVKNEMVAGIRVKGEPDEVLGCPTLHSSQVHPVSQFSSSEATAKAPLDEVVMDVGLQVHGELHVQGWKAENEAKIGVRFGEVKSSGLEHVELPLELRQRQHNHEAILPCEWGERRPLMQRKKRRGAASAASVAPSLPSRTTSAPLESSHTAATPRAFKSLQLRRKEGEEETTLKEALESSDAEEWKKAMESELKSIEENDTFELVELPEGRYGDNPEGFDDGSGRVWKLKKALYGLKQAPRQCCMTSSSARSRGDVNFYLGLHIERDVEKRSMRVHQRKYLEALAANFGQSEGHVATPFPSWVQVCEGPEEESVGEEERRRFHSLVGSLMYAAVNTRPDVAFATGQLARVVQCPNEEQVAAGMRVAKYLGQTPTVGLQYSAAAQRRQKGADGVEPGRLFLTAYSDASYASEPEDMTSVGGFICCVGGGPTAWESKKQVDQALSSVESEYMALFRAVREIVWQRRLLAELGEEQQGPTPLYCDSQGAIALAKNPVLHGLTKHMRVKWHWTRSMVTAGEVELRYVKTTGQPADMMTKRLVEQQHWKCCKLAGMALN
ncbi:unnamed protein product [Closterium sp. NIES-65]|nr:unnamed protein product [Closterium sp. NIES-65]